jgi:hypothetical protein
LASGEERRLREEEEGQQQAAARKDERGVRDQATAVWQQLVLPAGTLCGM